MKESMGQIIRRLRRERGITQEELADALGITSQAVSKWENDAGMPDISQLLPIANLFGISMDVLFSRNDTTADEQVESLIHEICTVRFPEYGCDYEKFLALNECLKTYPNHPKLLREIVRKGVFLASADDSEKNSFILTESLRAADRYIKISATIGDQISMICEKIDLYARSGRFTEAEALAAELDMRTVSREMCLADINRHRRDYSAEIVHRQNSVADLLCCLADEIEKLASAYRSIGQPEKAAEVSRINLCLPYTVHGNGEFHPPLFNFHMISGFPAACDLVELGKHEEALELLEKIFDYGEKQCRLCSSCAAVSSPVLDRIDMTCFHGELREADYLHAIEWDDFKPLHGYERFQELMKRYRAYSE